MDEHPDVDGPSSSTIWYICHVTRCAGWQALPVTLEAQAGDTVVTCTPRQEQSHRGGNATHNPHHEGMAPLWSEWRGVGKTTTTLSSEAGPRFFNPVQPHVVESARYAWAATIIPSQSAKRQSYGMDQQTHPEKASRECWSQQMASHSALTGRSPGAAVRSVTQIDTDAQGAENPTMGLKDALKHRGHNPLTPSDRRVLPEQLARLGLEGKYPHLIQGLTEGFNVGIPQIQRTYAPPNHASVKSLADVYSKIIDSKFTAGCYICLFSQNQLERALGPFQSSPLSLVPKMTSPGTYHAVHNFSHPHVPSSDAISINSHINCNNFLCTWGTFSMVALLITCLPPGSQASIRDVAEAYRTIPVKPNQWPGLIIRLQADDQFAVNVCNNFGLTSARGVYGMLADAGADIFRGHGMGPLAKWVDDHVFFRVPRTHLHSYNTQHVIWCQEIQMNGGHRQEGS